ncbi:hypothetical protein K1F50_15765 [Muricauda oceani]|uniref:hypothetical protein n=1 Tax=Flagellimonas oceani TaxID=2698672 RepID=UPI001C680CA7|nr:hypothetical protein [Allomuricauda oceani]MBW8244266.1 hypothetical protein [Allomuricauda oceani]
MGRNPAIGPKSYHSDTNSFHNAFCADALLTVFLLRDVPDLPDTLVPLPFFGWQNNNTHPCGRHKAASLFIRPVQAWGLYVQQHQKKVMRWLYGK